MSAIEMSYFYDIVSSIFGVGLIYIAFVIVYLPIGIPMLTDIIERWKDIGYHEAKEIATRIYKKTLKPVIASAALIMVALVFFPSERTMDVIIGKKLIEEYGNSPIVVKMYNKIMEDQK